MGPVYAWPDRAISRGHVKLARTGEAAAPRHRIPLDLAVLGGDNARQLSTLIRNIFKGREDDMTESVSQVASAEQVAAQNTYNFNLSVSGQLVLAAQETENIQENIDETVQTS